WLGLVGGALMLASFATIVRPDVLVSADGRLMAARDADGGLVFSSLRTARFEREIWQRRDGQDTAAAWPAEGASPAGALTCDPSGCLYRNGTVVVALARDRSAAAEDCGLADILIAAVPVAEACPADLVVDRFDVWRWGAYALYLENGRPRAVSVGETLGNRPWTRHRERRWPEETAADQFLPPQ